MPQPAKKSSQVTGPHVEAVICERLIQESDGVLSAMRLIDVITHVLPNAAAASPPSFVVNLTILIVVHADGASGRFVIKLGATTPAGVSSPPIIEQTLDLQPGPLGANLIIPFGMPFAEEGTYWFDVWLRRPRARADQLVTRTPLSVVYAQPASAS